MTPRPQDRASAASDSREVESANDRYAIEHPHGNWRVSPAATGYDPRSVAWDRLRLDAETERHGFVLVGADDLRAVMEVAERADELARFLGPNGAPDHRFHVAALDAALNALDGGTR